MKKPVILRLKQSRYSFYRKKNGTTAIGLSLRGVGFSNFLPLPTPKGETPRVSNRYGALYRMQIKPYTFSLLPS